MTLNELLPHLRSVDKDLAIQVCCDVYGVEDTGAPLSADVLHALLILDFMGLVPIGRSDIVRLAILRVSRETVARREVICLADNRYVLCGNRFYDVVDRVWIEKTALRAPALRSMIDVEVILTQRLTHAPDNRAEGVPGC